MCYSPMNPNSMFSMQKHSKKEVGGIVLVWENFAPSRVGSLHFILGTISSYTEFLQQNLHQRAENVWLQGCSGCIRTTILTIETRLWLLYNCRSVMPLPQQPPELNWISRTANCVRNLLPAAVENAFTGRMERNLSGLLPLVRAKGEHTKYQLLLFCPLK